MRIALGTVEVDDADKKTLGKALTGSAYVKRDQVRDWLLEVVHDAISEKINPTPQGPDAAHRALAPNTAPEDAGDLPEPAPPVAPAT